jgi:hypothetical protein
VLVGRLTSRQPEAQPCQDNPSLGRPGRLCLTKNHTTLIIIIINLLFLSGIIALSYLRLLFRLTKTTRHSPTLLIAFQIPAQPASPRPTAIYLFERPWRRSTTHAHLCVFVKSVIRLQHGYAQLLLLKSSRCTQSRFLLVSADLGLIIFLLSSSHCDKISHCC